MKKKDIYKVIDSERKYQIQIWPEGEKRKGMLGGIQLLRKYLDHDFSLHYTLYKDEPGLDVPKECLEDIRKMAAILVRIMENNEIPPRK